MRRGVKDMYCFSTMEEFSGLREIIKNELSKMLVSGVEPLFVAINEAVNNAIFHGNKQDKTKKVYLTIRRSPGEIKIVIRDEGNGFVPVERPQPTEDLQEHGRGLAIIGFCVDHYYFNELFNEMVLIKKVALSPTDERKAV